MEDFLSEDMPSYGHLYCSILWNFKVVIDSFSTLHTSKLIKSAYPAIITHHTLTWPRLNGVNQDFAQICPPFTL